MFGRLHIRVSRNELFTGRSLKLTDFVQRPSRLLTFSPSLRRRRSEPGSSQTWSLLSFTLRLPLAALRTTRHSHPLDPALLLCCRKPGSSFILPRPHTRSPLFPAPHQMSLLNQSRLATMTPTLRMMASSLTIARSFTPRQASILSWQQHAELGRTPAHLYSPLKQRP